MLTRALFLPCLDLTESGQAESAELASHGPVQEMSGCWLRWNLLQNITRLARSRKDGLWLWVLQTTIPHYCAWLIVYVNWATARAGQHELRIDPYLVLSGRFLIKCASSCLV